MLTPPIRYYPTLNRCNCCCNCWVLQQVAEGEENEFKGCTEVSEMRRKEMEGLLKPEPLLIENPGRFVLFPIQDNEVSLFFFPLFFLQVCGGFRHLWGHRSALTSKAATMILVPRASIA